MSAFVPDSAALSRGLDSCACNSMVPVSAYSSAQSYGREAYISKKPKKGKKLLVACAVIMALLLIVGGVAFGGVVYVNSISDKLHANVTEELTNALSAEETVPGEPFYMLILGVDRSEERDESGEYGDTYRSDSMILTRVDPQQKRLRSFLSSAIRMWTSKGMAPIKSMHPLRWGGLLLWSIPFRNLLACPFPITWR
ncbi:MAG: hypothetical protein ACLTQI_03120 [Slackia sp.]